MKKKLVRFFTLWDHTPRNDGRSDDGQRFVGTLSIYADGSTLLGAGDYGIKEAQEAFLSCHNGDGLQCDFDWVDESIEPIDI